jgi:hypothetical protein
MVDTNLDKGARKARGQTYFGMSLADFIVPTMKSFANDEYEIRVRDQNLPAQWGDHPAKKRTQ